MGSIIEINDTLQITTEQGFPKTLDLERHKTKPFCSKDFVGKTFSFKGKEGCRIYHPAPTRCFLVHNIGGKWLYWGEIVVTRQTIDAIKKTTSGEYCITKIYDPDFQRLKTLHESPDGKGYFPG